MFAVPNQILRNDADAKNLLRIFPKEIWIMILDRFSDSNTFQSISLSSSFFKHLLLPRHQLAMIWNILAFNMELQINRSFEGTYQHLITLDSSHKRRLGWIFNLRLTCKLLKQTVSLFPQNLQQHFYLSSENRLGGNFMQTFGETKIDGSYDFRSPLNFLQSFESSYTDSSAGNPFINRGLYLDLGAVMQSGWQHVLSVLSKFGHHVWYLRIVFPNKYSTKEIYLHFKQILELTPKLQKLEAIKYINYGQTSEFCHILNTIQANPMPVISTLKHVIVDNVPYPISKELLCRNSHIETLEHQLFFFNIFSVKGFITHVIKIKNLELFISNIQLFETLENFNEDVELEKLILFFRLDKTPLKWSRIFSVIEKLGRSTITNLYLALPLQNVNYENSIKLNLINVTDISLETQNVENLDFILPMKNTLNKLTLLKQFEYVPVRGYFRDPEAVLVNSSGNIPLQAILESPLKFSIWTHFEKLKCLVLKPAGMPTRSDVYTRQDLKH